MPAAGAWAGMQHSGAGPQLGQRERESCEAREQVVALGRQSGPDATRAASPRGPGQSGRRRGVHAAAAPQPLSLPSR